MTKSKPVKWGLNRGLGSLMADINADETTTQGQHYVPIEQVSPNPDQPRRQFDGEQLQQLAESLKSRGILQPLIVRRHPSDEGRYQIVAGERRWRAAQMAQLHELPVIIREMSDNEVLEVALIENIQRSDLNSIEEAASFRLLMERFGHTQEKLAEALNKSRSHIANALRLLNLPDSVQDLVKSGKLSAGHARALITTPNAADLARKVIEKDLSVRATEELVRQQSELTEKKQKNLKAAGKKDADTRALESDLSAHLRMRVSIDHSGENGGKVTISYRDLDQLDRVCQLLGSGE